MRRFRSKLNKLKLGNIIHLSITEIKKQYGKDCVARFGRDVLNAIHDKRVMMKIGNKCIPFNIDNIRNLSKWFYPYEEQDNFCSDEAFCKVVMNKPYISFIPVTTKFKHQRQVHTGAFFKYYILITRNSICHNIKCLKTMRKLIILTTVYFMH